MSKTPIIISIMNTKGGAGKTSILQLLATHINYYYPSINLRVIDCDLGNKSSFHLREEDISMLNQIESQTPNTKIGKIYKELKENNAIYPVELMKANEMLDAVNYCLTSDKNQYDIIFIDSPGEFGSDGFKKTLGVCDYVFIPCKPDEKNIAPSVELYHTIEKIKTSGGLKRLKYCSLFLNDVEHFIDKIKIIERIDDTYLFLCEKDGNPKLESDINILDNSVPRKSDISQSILTSVIPIVPEHKTEHYLKSFISELNQIIKILN